MNGTASPTAAPASAALRSFEAQWQTRPRDSLWHAREQSLRRFLALGLPSTRDESWRYTNLRSLNGMQFVDAPEQQEGVLEPFASVSLLDGTQRAATVVMVNGRPRLQISDTVINDIEISSLKEMSRLDSEFLSRYVDAPSDDDKRRFALLNTALYIDGLYLRITRTVATPLVILHVGIGVNHESASYPKIIIDVAEGAGATIIEHYVGQGEHTPLTNSSTHISLGRNARIEHYRVFATSADALHFDTLDIRQQRDSRCKQFTIAMGGGLVRAHMDVQLSESGASIDSHSLLVGFGSRLVDCVNTVTHAAPDTRSRQTARAIASETSHVIFNSKVIVDKGAMRSESQQSCRGLLLSESAEIDTRPQLEIHADEVKCAHGATTGRLDPDMLFYLLSRGLDRNTAQSLLVFAFLADVLTGMSVASARTAVENALISQMPDSQLLRSFR